MKKALLSALAICMICLASCNKDKDSNNGGTPGGAQTIGARLSAIWDESVYYQEESYDNGVTWVTTQTMYNEKYKKESWTWNGNKPSSFTICEGIGYGSFTDDYIYDDNNKLVKFLEEGYIYEISYTGDRISSIRTDDGSLDVSYSNNKIKKIEGIMDEEYFGVNFYWNGDNLSKLTISDDDENEIDWIARFNSYDNGKNPYCDFNATLFYLFSWGLDDMGYKLSANNCTSLDYDEGPITIEYSYNSKQYPTKAIRTHISNSDNYGGTLHRTRTVTTYTYEYLD